MDELYRRLLRFLRSLKEQLQFLLPLLEEFISELRFPSSFQELKELFLWAYMEIKTELTTIYMRSLLKLTDYAIEGIFYLAILLEGFLDGGNYKSPGLAMDNLISMVVRVVAFVSYLVWSFTKLHTWLLDMSLSQLVPFVFNTDYPLLLKIL